MPKSEAFDRSEVLEKVTHLFWEKGYNGTSMQDIVDVSGLNRSSLYNSFGDKYKLFEATLDFYKKHVQDASLKNVSHLPAKQAIRVLFEGVLTAMKTGDHKGCYLANCTSELSNADKNIYRTLHSNMKHMVDMLKDMLEAGKSSGEFSQDLDTKKAAIYLFSSLQGLRVTAMLSTSQEDMKVIIDKTLAGV